MWTSAAANPARTALRWPLLAPHRLVLFFRWASSGPGYPKLDTSDAVALPDGSLLHRPREPLDDECCGRGCSECVWTAYWESMQAYEVAKADASGAPRPIDPFEALERRLAGAASAHSPGPTPPKM